SPISRRKCAVTPNCYAPAPLDCRIIYFGTGRDLGGVLEVIEINSATEEPYRRMYQAARAWNGKDPIVHRN
ncbi:MAG: hypothetical protein KGI48_11275, partial [Hyphomicrobiales bacterium]|nr:hypothetical protein [Hyphomicrobiales bacterium]